MQRSSTYSLSHNGDEAVILAANPVVLFLLKTQPQAHTNLGRNLPFVRLIVFVE